ncbi:MAG: hypothetical protein MJ131_05865, partial [Lachnospiraceae bacterium]|nr:hypothetical protein [Lachnospiraceae bacterium]
LTIGDTFTMSGTVSGNGGKLEKVYINVFKTDENSYSKILCDRSGLGATSFNLSNVGAVVSGKDYFAKEGTYTLYIHAKNEGGESVKLAEKTITVKKAEQTPPIVPPTGESGGTTVPPTGGSSGITIPPTGGSGGITIPPTGGSSGIVIPPIGGGTFIPPVIIDTGADKPLNGTENNISNNTEIVDDTNNTGNVIVDKPETGKSDKELAEEDKRSLVLGFSDGDNEKSVTDNLSLKKKGSNGSVITWSSNNTDVISNKGKVTRSTIYVGVKLTATITHGEYSCEKTFSVLVVAAKKTDRERVEDDYGLLKISYADGDSRKNVTKNLTLPTKGVNGSKITWESSNRSIITEKGAVTRTNTDTKVTLTATISYGSAESMTDTFVIVVKAAEGDQNLPEITPVVENIVTPNVDSSDDKAPKSFKITSPKSGYTLKSGGSVEIKWSESKNASYYRVSVYNKSTSKRVIKSSKIKTTSYLIGYYELKLDEEYYVVVTAHNDFGGINSKEISLYTSEESEEPEKPVEKIGKITVSSKEENGVFTISMSSDLSKKSLEEVDHTWINIYDKSNKNKLVESQSIKGAATSINSSVPVGKYGVEVVYYDANKNVLASGDALIEYNLSLTEDELVQEIELGETATLYGTVASVKGLKSIKVVIKDENGKSVHDAVTVDLSGKTAFKLNDELLDSKLKFDTLELGNLMVTLVVTDVKGNTLKRSYPLSVIDSDQKINVICKSSQEQIVVSFQHNLTPKKAKTVDYAWINIYDKEASSRLFFSTCYIGIATNFDIYLTPGEYGIEVAYYNSSKKMVARGEARFAHSCDYSLDNLNKLLDYTIS